MHTRFTFYTIDAWRAYAFKSEDTFKLGMFANAIVHARIRVTVIKIRKIYKRQNWVLRIIRTYYLYFADNYCFDNNVSISSIDRGLNNGVMYKLPSLFFAVFFYFSISTCFNKDYLSMSISDSYI